MRNNQTVIPFGYYNWNKKYALTIRIQFEGKSNNTGQGSALFFKDAVFLEFSDYKSSPVVLSSDINFLRSFYWGCKSLLKNGKSEFFKISDPSGGRDPKAKKQITIKLDNGHYFVNCSFNGGGNYYGVSFTKFEFAAFCEELLFMAEEAQKMLWQVQREAATHP